MEDLKSIVTDIMRDLQDDMRTNLGIQGHRLTGKLENSITFTVDQITGNVIGTMYFEDYGQYVEVGVSANRIPFSGKSGRGGTSKYIQGLIRFWQLRGLSSRDAKGAAFATATKHKREGMPSRDSYRYSANGKRTGFTRDAIEAQLPKIEKALRAKYLTQLELRFADVFQGFENLSISR